MRHWAPIKDERSLWWKVIGRNKRLVTLNLSTPRGQDLFKALVRDADIVVENYRPGTFERWGLGYDVLSRINPRLIFVRVSGFGQSGPYAKRGGYGTIAEAFSGIPSFTGFPDRPPTLPGFPMADSVAATFLGHGRHVRGLQPRPGRGRPWPGNRRQPLRAAVPAGRGAGDRLRPARHRQGTSGQPARRGFAAKHLPDAGRTLGRHLGLLAEDLRASRPRDGQTGADRRPPLSRQRAALPECRSARRRDRGLVR